MVVVTPEQANMQEHLDAIKTKAICASVIGITTLIVAINYLEKQADSEENRKQYEACKSKVSGKESIFLV